MFYLTIAVSLQPVKNFVPKIKYVYNCIDKLLESKPLNNQAALLARIAEGDEKAFMVLYRHYYALLKPIVLKYTDDGIDADEVLQQAFLIVWLNRELLPEVENPGGWIYKVAYREYLKALRKKLNYENKLEQFSALQQADDSQVLPHDVTHLDDLKKSIRDVVDNLSPQRKQIYELSRNEGLSINQIADRLSLSPQTVKNVLSIVLKIIREHLTAHGFGPLAIFIFFTII